MPQMQRDVHDLEPEEFLEHVHSFEFWFQALEETVREIGLPADERTKLGRAYLGSVQRLGFV